ncbi:MAG: ABC transporter permease [Lachnospiraceae bacterium]|nr:ABC transporter permease [Lachnospiraceae bacterium]
MKPWDMLRLSVSNLLKRKLRTVLTVLGVVIGVASIVVMVSLGLGLSRSLTEEMESFGNMTCVTVTDLSTGGFYMGEESEKKDKEKKHLDDKAIAELSQLDNVEQVTPMLTTNVICLSGAYMCNADICGVPEGYLEEQGVELEKGTYPEQNGTPEVLYGNMVVPSMYNDKTESGYFWDGRMADVDVMKDPVMFVFDTDTYYNFKGNVPSDNGKVPAMPKKHLLPATGLIAGGPDEYTQHAYTIYTDLEDLKTLLKKEFKGKAIPGQPTTASGKPYKEIYYSRLMVYAASMDDVSDLQKEIRSMGYGAESDIEWIKQSQDQMKLVEVVLGGIGAVSLLVAAIGIANTMMMSIYERTKEIGIMKVLGCDMRNIQAMFLIEAGFIGLIGGVVGLILSYIISAVINVFGAGLMEGMGMGSEMTGISYIPFWLSAIALIFAILVGMIAGFFPSLRAMKLSPLAAIRNE